MLLTLEEILIFSGLFSLILIGFIILFAFVKRVETIELSQQLENSGYPYLAKLVLCSGHNLSHVDLHNINFHQASMEGFNLCGCQLQDAKFTCSHCNWINLSESMAVHSHFDKVKMKHADLHKANFEGSSFYYANLKGSDLEDADFRNTNLKGANLARINQKNTHWEGAVFNKDTHLPFNRDLAFKKGMVFMG